jgi:uncharacterized lipoprotein
MVTIHPFLNLPSRDIGQGRTIALEVVDNRQNLAFGPRGGVYSATALITPAGDLATSVRDALVAALHNYRFVVAQPGALAPVRMSVSIDEIRYTPSGHPMVHQVRTDAVLSANCDFEGRQYKIQFKVSSVKDVFPAPSAEENTKLLNAVISKGLQRMMDDEGLLKCLGG